MSRTAAAGAICALAVLLAACGGDEQTAPAPPRAAPPPAQPAVDLDPGDKQARKRVREQRRERAAKPAASGRPAIVKRPIDMGAQRRAEMAAYSQRHYGEAGWRLEPRAIVQHYTASDSFESAYATFAQNTPDVELNELPGVCAHFIVDSDGTIYQLVKATIRCRHTVGLNWAAIGIEHVGTSDAQVMGNAAQLDSSLALTRWLQCTYGIETEDVIGHNESLSSPLHRENVARLRSQTHDDMQRATMAEYRRELGPPAC